MNITRLREDLIRDEGCKLHAYTDHLGYWTIGIGRLIDVRGGGISVEEAHFLLDNDIARVQIELERRISFWDSLNEDQQRGLANMAFQMGVNGLLKFERMLAALKAKDAVHIEKEAKDSKWYRQTPERAKRVIECLTSF